MRMPRFREFDTTRTAAAGILIIAAALVFAFLYPQLPWVAGHTYKAEFSDGGGMLVGDYVEVAGTDVGSVTAMDLVGTKVVVSFTAKGVRLGNDTTAAIKTGTLLGKRYLGLTPGPGPRMSAGDVIPLSRTTAPYNVSQSIEQLTQQLHDFDKPKIEDALNSFAGAFQDTPNNFKATFANVKALSETISTRDAALRELLAHSNGVSAVLANRTGQFQSLVTNGNTLLAELYQRQEVLNQMFDDFTYVAEQARDFVRENNGELGPALDDLNKTLDVVQKNQHNIALAISRIGGFIGGLGEGVSSAPEFAAHAGLHTVGDIFNYTDVLRQAFDPQAPRVPNSPGLPGGAGTLPNPLAGKPSGASATPPNALQPPPNDPANAPVVPLFGGK